MPLAIEVKSRNDRRLPRTDHQARTNYRCLQDENTNALCYGNKDCSVRFTANLTDYKLFTKGLRFQHSFLANFTAREPPGQAINLQISYMAVLHSYPAESTITQYRTNQW